MTDDEIERVSYTIGFALGALFWIGLVAAAYYIGKRVGAGGPK